jgi:hypothetical protein
MCSSWFSDASASATDASFFTRDHRSISIKSNGNKRHQPEFREGKGITAYC